jgi:hypothetical protein
MIRYIPKDPTDLTGPIRDGKQDERPTVLCLALVHLGHQKWLIKELHRWL